MPYRRRTPEPDLGTRVSAATVALLRRREVQLAIAVVLVLLVLLAVVVHLHGDRPRRRRPAADPTPALQLREVWAVDSEPCRRRRPPQPAAEDRATLCGPDAEGDVVRYRLAPAVVSGGVEDARAVPAPGGRGYAVTITLSGADLDALSPVTQELHGTGGQVALVLGTRILAAPEIALAEVSGPLQLSGPFTRDDAEQLAAEVLAGG